MSKLPSYRRIYEQDYPKEYQDLVRTLSVSLNNAFDSLFDLMNGKITIDDNTASKVKIFQVQINNSGTPVSKVSVPKTSSDRISGLIVIKATNLTNSAVFPTTCPFISYTETSDSIIVNNITGLQINNLYELSVELLR